MLPRVGGRSSAWLELQIVDLVVAGSNPVGHPIFPVGYQIVTVCSWKVHDESMTVRH